MADFIMTCWRNYKEDTEEMLATSKESLNREMFLHVRKLLMETDVRLLLTPVPLLGQKERTVLQNYKKSKSKNKEKNPTRTSKRKSTLADEIRLTPMTAQSENQQQNNTGRKRFRSDDATNGPSNQQMPLPRAPHSNQQRPTHTITSETLEDLLCDENIKIERVETDYNRPETGPWHYHDSAKCIVHISLNNATKVEVRLYDLIYGEYRIPPQPRNDATTSTSTTTTPHPPTSRNYRGSRTQRCELSLDTI